MVGVQSQSPALKAARAGYIIRSHEHWNALRTASHNTFTIVIPSPTFVEWIKLVAPMCLVHHYLP